MTIIVMGMDNSLHAKSKFINNLNEDITVKFKTSHTIKAGKSAELNGQKNASGMISAIGYTTMRQTTPDNKIYTITGTPGTDGNPGTFTVTVS